MRKYEKWIGYCFWDNIQQKEVVLNAIGTYDNGKNCYYMSEKQENGSYKHYICDYSAFKHIWKGTINQEFEEG